MSATSNARGVRAATARCWRRRQPGHPGRRAPLRAGALDRGRRRGCPGLPMDRSASGSATSTPSASPSAGSDPAVSGDTPLGSGGPGRSRRRAGPGSAAGAAGRAGAYGVLHCRGGVGGGRRGASGAVSAAGHQPQHAAELGGGGCGGAAECVGQPGRDRGGDELRGGADAMVDRPPRRGVRARRSAGIPFTPGVVGRHAAAAVGGDGAGHHVRRCRGDNAGTRPAGR